MAVYRVGPNGNRWRTRAEASREARKMAKREGGETYVVNEDTGKVVISFRHQGLGGRVVSERGNPSRRRTKAQKKAASSKRSKQKRIADALKKYLQTQNPGTKYAGAKIQRNKGSITIIPIKLKRAR